MKTGRPAHLAPFVPGSSQQRNTSRRAALAPVPVQRELPGFHPACVDTLTIGRRHGRLAPDNPYQLCLTKNQSQHLWKKHQRKHKLGCGVFACAWARTKNTVVKITNDQSDVEALKRANAAGLHKGTTAVVPKLYRAFTLKSPTTSQQPVYGMVVERLRTESELPPGATTPIFCMRDVYDEAPEMLERHCCPQPDESDYDPRSAKLCKTLSQQVGGMVGRVRALDISTTDLHPGNIGLGYDGRWKILDLGLSGLPYRHRAAPTLKGR